MMEVLALAAPLLVLGLVLLLARVEAWTLRSRERAPRR
jgi:hypothetical protein